MATENRLPKTSPAAVEAPNRLTRFGAALRALEWDQGGTLASLDRLASALEDLAQVEVEYYYARRKKLRTLSWWCRACAWSFGSLGFLAPLIHAALEMPAPWLPSLGYVFLAAAGSMLALNSLFGGTATHIRSTTAQLALERTLTLFRIDWQLLRRKRLDQTVEQAAAEGFECLRSFSVDLYQILENETSRWGETTTDALTNYSNLLKTPQD